MVQDQTGSVLPGAQVTLVAAGAPAQTMAGDAAGTFRFDRVVPGGYDLRVEFPGFTISTPRLRVGTRAAAPLTIVMQIEGLNQEVSVTSGGAQTSAAAGANPRT